MLFVFIKTRDDLLLYVALIAATGLFGNLSMWGYLKYFLVKVDWKGLCVRRHLKETIVYFIPTIATSVYTILDKTMLGWFTGSDKSENGYYEYATGFVNMAKILIMSFNAVMSARMSYLFGEERREEIHRKVEESLDFVLLLGIPIMAGLAGIAAGFVPWFLGEGYEPVAGLMYVCCPLVLIVGLSDCMGSLILTPSGQRAKSGKVIVAGACVNFVLNLALIPHFGAAGAAGASVAGGAIHHRHVPVAVPGLYKAFHVFENGLEAASGSRRDAGSGGGLRQGIVDRPGCDIFPDRSGSCLLFCTALCVQG